MAFVRMKGIEGLLFVPDEQGGDKKHPCKDCYHCQWCSDNRCSLCLADNSCSRDACRNKNTAPRCEKDPRKKQE